MKHPDENLGRQASVRLRSRSRQRRLRIPDPASSRGQLNSLARLYGIQTFYIDVAGQKQEAAPETLKALLAEEGVSISNPQEIRMALHEGRSRAWRQCLEPVMVSWNGKPADIELLLPASVVTRALSAKLVLEDGTIRKFSIDPTRLRTLCAAEADGQPVVAKQFRLPQLPWGYHQFEVRTSGGICRSLIIAAPAQSYSPPELRKKWGIFLPAYALHSNQSWGAGNWSDWARFSEWVATLGGGVIATLPLTAAFLDRPICEPSPYSPASRLFWNEFYLDVTRIPEFSRCAPARKLVESAQFQRRLNEFRKSSLIDYASQMAARRQALELLAKSFFRSGESTRKRAFESFLRERPDAETYASFRAACDETNAAWRTWPEQLREGNLRRRDYRTPLQRYHLYAQWLAQEQITSLIESSKDKGVKLFLDLPLGVHPDSYDTWRYREIFAMRATTGAPPDTFFTKGQNWGFAPLHPERTRRDQYRYVLEYLRFQMRHTGLLRIDHVMGLHRLYWIPHGFPADAGAYVNYPAEELYAILNLESHRHQTMLAGEDLGTVPPQVKASMKRHRLGQTYVLQYELKPDAKVPMRRPPAHAVASLNTHDMPSFAAYWQGLDIADRAVLGLVKKKDVNCELSYRRKLNQSLVQMLIREGFLKNRKGDAATVFRVCLEFLAASRSNIVLVNLEDLWSETRPQNVPGTWNERPNWRRKARVPLDRIVRMAELREILKRLDALRRG